MRKLITSAILVSLFFAFGCDDSSTNTTITDGDSDSELETGESYDPFADMTDDDILTAGKKYLSENNYGAAEEFFNELLRRNPDHPEGTYGLVLSDVQHWVTLINMLLGLVFDESEVHTIAPGTENARWRRVMGKMTAASDLESVNPIAGLLENVFIQDLRALQEEQLARLEKLKSLPDVGFILEQFPIAFHRQQMFSLHSEWDMADVYMIDALTQGLYSLILILDSQSLSRTRIAEIYPDLISGLDMETLPGLILRLFDEFPSFLSLESDGVGEENFAKAKTAMETMASDIQTAYDLIQAETDDQSDDILGKGNKRLGVEWLNLNGTFYTSDGDTFNSFKLLWEGEKYGLKQTAEQVSANMAGDSGKRVRVSHDILAIAGILADLLKQTIGLDPLLDMLGLELDPTIVSLINGIDSDDPEALPSTLVSALPLLLFDTSAIELDLGSFLDRPVGLRNVLPNWQPGDDFTDGSFYTSYECARLGWGNAAWESALGEDGTGTLTLTLDDPFLAENNASVEIIVLGEGENAPVINDRESFEFTNGAEGTNLKFATIPIALVNAAGSEADGTVQLLQGASEQLVAQYTESSVAESPILIEAAFDIEGQTDRVWSSSMNCVKDTSRDVAHFETVDETFMSLPDDGDAELTSSYSPIPQDGYGMSSPYLAWRSGSINNLLWVDLGKLAPSGYKPDEYGIPTVVAKTDVTTLNLFIAFVMASLE